MKIVFAIASCLLFSVIDAQSKKFSFKLGEEYELPRKTEDLAFFGNENAGIINLSLKKEELHIVRFDPKSLRQTVEKTIELPDATKNFNSEEIVILQNNYFWLHSDWDKGNEKEMLFYDKMDVVTGKITEANHKLFETTRLKGTPVATSIFYSFKQVNKYKFNYDDQQKKLLVSYVLYPEEKNAKKSYDKIGLQVFDEHMNKLWGNEFTMPYTDAIMDNSDFSLDSKGNAYLLAKVYDNDSRKEKDKETGKPGYHFEVLKFTKESKQITHTAIAIGDYYINQPSLIENAQHEMVIAATYSKKVNSGGTDGIFLAVINTEGAVIKYKNGYYEFPLAELKKFESARAQRKMDKKDDYEGAHLVVKNIVVEEDASVFVACEEVFSETGYYSSGSGSTSSYTVYYHNDILAAKINATGEFGWLKKIPKQQKASSAHNGLGYKLVTDESGYYFLYLDNKKNMDLAEDEVPKYHVDGAGGQVVVAKLDKKGTLKREIVFDTREEDVRIYPAQFSRINGNQFIGRAKVKKNLFQPLLITVN